MLFAVSSKNENLYPVLSLVGKNKKRSGFYPLTSSTLAPEKVISKESIA